MAFYANRVVVLMTTSRVSAQYVPSARPYYTSGPRVPAPAPLDRYYRWDWQVPQPKPGELEYLGKL